LSSPTCLSYPAQLSSPSCPVPVVQSQLSSPRCPVQDVLSKMSCPRCPVQDVLSKTSCPDSSVLSRLSCLNYALVPVALPRPHGPLPDTTLMSWQSCHLSPFQAHLSRLPACLSQLSSLNRRSYSIPVILSLLSCPCCHILAVLPLFPILAVLSCVSFRLSCPGFPVLAGFSRLSC
jgi:hypothetical protein